MTESVNIILCAFAFGLFILYLSSIKPKIKALPGNSNTRSSPPRSILVAYRPVSRPA